MAQSEQKWSAPLEFLASIYPVSAFSAQEVQFLQRTACTVASYKAKGSSASQLQLRLNSAVLDRLLLRDLGLACSRAREAAYVVLLVAVSGLHAVRFNCVSQFVASVAGPGLPFASASMPYAKAVDLCTFANWLDVGVKYMQCRDPRTMQFLRNVCVRLVRGDAAEPDLGGATDADFDVLLEYMLRPRPMPIPGLRVRHQRQRSSSARKDDDQAKDGDDGDEDGGSSDSRTTSPTTAPATPDSSADDTHASEESSSEMQIPPSHRDKKPRHTHTTSFKKATTTTSTSSPFSSRAMTFPAATTGLRAAPQPTTTTALSSERFHRTSDRSPKRPRVSAGFEFVSARIVPPV